MDVSMLRHTDERTEDPGAQEVAEQLKDREGLGIIL